MRIDPADLGPKDLYLLMTSVIVPRPIAWVSTRRADGALNAAPFSYFQALSSAPPTVMVSIGRRRDGSPKDTLANIEATKEFVINVVSEESAERMVRTSFEYEYGESEFEKVGLEAVPAERVQPPRIGESAVSMECRLDRILTIGSSSVVIGEVLLFHLRDDVVGPDGLADPVRLRPLGRLGGSGYAPLRDLWTISREGEAAAPHSPWLAFWRELRERTIAMARALEPEHLGRHLSPKGMTVGELLRHVAAFTLAGKPEEEPGRIADELAADRDAFLEAMRTHLPRKTGELMNMIRHESWHQGQVAAAVPERDLWSL
jgi:flavin reductase (DIM6/NTAB) family NADH-FMN oxidoreductase RutF